MFNAVWLNADNVRKEYNDWDFSAEGRTRQANRMKQLAQEAVDSNRIVVADFICPTQKTRDNFNADYVIWMDTIKEGRFEDTNQMFEEPKSPNFVVTHYDAEMWSFMIKNDITDHIIKNVDRPQRYGYLLKVCQMLEDISNRKLNINHKKLRSFAKNNILRDIASGSGFITYNQFGSKTGRLTTAKKSFPILTLKKDYRSIIEPVNDRFLEIDFNGAEARVLLGLLGRTQPDGDVHNFHRDEVFSGSLTREESKTSFFAWLYGAKSINDSKEGDVLKRFYDKDSVIDQYWNGSTVVTPLGKVIEGTNRHHALNYIVQSTTAELTLLQALKVDYLLRTRAKKSFISCIIHDSVVIDLSDEDHHLVGQIKTLMSSTKFGVFNINISMGNSLGNLKRYEE